MRYDEAVTYLYFAAKPWATVVGSYQYPNNHVLHTVLVKLCLTLFGNAPWALRLPATLGGIGIVPLTYLVGRRLVGSPAAWLGTAIVATSAPLIVYSANARGYSLVCFASLVLLLLLLRLRDRPSMVDWVGVVVTTALGMWTIPVMLYPAGGLALWFAWSAILGDTSDGRRDLRRLLLAMLATALVTALCYSPILFNSGAHPLTANKFVSASAWQQFFAELLATMPGLWDSWRIGLPIFVVMPLAALALVGVIVSRARPERRVPVSAAMYIWCAALLLATRTASRFFASGCSSSRWSRSYGRRFGVTSLLALIPRSGYTPDKAPAVALGTAIVFGIAVVSSRAVLLSRETGTLRDAPEITQALGPLLRPGDRVIAPVPSNAPLQYYFLRAGLDTSYLSGVPDSAAKVYLVVNTAEGQTAESPLGERFVQQFSGARLMGKFPVQTSGRAATTSAEVYQLVRDSVKK